jgi:long-chain acyl-CoA synthetase
LADAGIGANDRVAIIAANNELFVVALLAVVGLGAVAVPLNPQSPGTELQRELSTARCVAIIAGPGGARALADVDRSALLDLRFTVVPDGVDLEGAITFADFIGGSPREVVAVDGDATCVLLFTSGTAGAPRPAVLSHHNLLVNQEQMLTADPGAMVRGDVVLAVLPLFHVYGLNVVLGTALRVGAAVVLAERFDVDRSLDLIRDHKITVLAAAPPVWHAWAGCLASPEAFASVRIARIGAAALDLVDARQMAERFGLTVAEGYGLTEAAPVVAVPPEGDIRPGSVGRPLPGLDARLVDSDGRDALVGDAGELWVRGPNVFSGYDNDPEATAAVLDADGWLHTGDVAVADEDGHLSLVDRIKDLIIVSGFNVYPAQVEDVLVLHPLVTAAVVVGRPAPGIGERVVAHVAVGDHVVEEDELIDFCAQHLPRYKTPSVVEVHRELPVGVTGKIPRRLFN